MNYHDYKRLEKGERVLKGHFFFDIDGNLLTVDETDIGNRNGIDNSIEYYRCKYGHQLTFPFYDKTRSYHPNWEPDLE